MPVLTKINTNSIAEDAITGDKFAGDAYLANTATQNISGTYSENRLYTSDAYTLSGNATVNSNLTLSTVKSSGDVVLTAGGAYTITGTGVLSAGSLVAKGKTDLSDMTGVLGSAVTQATGFTLGSGVTFPEGHVIKVTHSKDSGIRTHGSNSWSKAGNTLDCVVTPKSTSSIFLIGCCIGVYSTGDFSCTFFRDSTNLGDANDGISRLVNKNNFGGGVIDSPNTTSTITYSFQIRAIDSATTSLGYDDAESFMYVMEIQG